MFNALLGCFTPVATFPEDSLSENTKKHLLIISIIIGFIHIINEIRQFIYDHMEWIFDPWNYLGRNTVKFNYFIY